MNRCDDVSRLADCPVCRGPLIWSIDHRQLWCAVYGSHQLDSTAEPAAERRRHLVAL